MRKTPIAFRLTRSGCLLSTQKNGRWRFIQSVEITLLKTRNWKKLKGTLQYLIGFD